METVLTWATRSAKIGISRGMETAGRLRSFLCALGVVLLLPLSALANTFLLPNVEPFIAVNVGSNPNDPQYTSNPGGFYDGVALLDIFIGGQLAAGCSGALIDPTHVLTASHCVEDPGTSEIDVHFEGGSSFVASSWVFDPLFNINQISGGNDLGIVTLPSAATGLTPYQLYMASGLGATVDIAGFGITLPNASNFGTFRHGQNQYDVSTPALYEFYLDSAGEVTTCEGDSGGPSFINGELAGVHSFGDAGCRSFGADIPVAQSANLAFIEANSSLSDSVPEPPTLLMLGSVMLAGSVVWRSRRG